MKIKYTISIRKKATEAFYEPCNKALGMVVELGEVRLSIGQLTYKDSRLRLEVTEITISTSYR